MAGLYMSSSSLAARAGTNHSFCYSSLDKLEMYAKAVVPPCHRLNHIKATDAQTDFVGSIGRRSPIGYTSISFQTSSLSLLLQPCHQRTPPFQDQKFEEMALLYILKFIRIFSTIFCKIFSACFYYISSGVFPLHASCINATDTQTDFVGSIGRRSPIDYTSISLQTSSLSLLLQPCHQRTTPSLFKTKNLKKWPYFTFWNLSEFSLLYFTKIFLLASTSLLTFSFLRHGSKRPTHKRTFFVPSVVGLPLTTLLFHFKPLLYHCFNILTIKGPPPFQDQKFEEIALLYILKFIRIFSTIFYYSGFCKFIFTICLPCVLLLNFLLANVFFW